MCQDCRFWVEAEQESREKKNHAELVKLREENQKFREAIVEIRSMVGNFCAAESRFSDGYDLGIEEAARVLEERLTPSV